MVVFVLSDCCARDGLHKICENIVEAMLVLGIFIFFQNKVTAIGGGDHVYFVDSFTFFKWVEETTTYQKGSKGQTKKYQSCRVELHQFFSLSSDLCACGSEQSSIEECSKLADIMQLDC